MYNKPVRFSLSFFFKKLEKNSNYIRGFTLDSQTFGSKRNIPDVISRPGENGYKEFMHAAREQDYQSMERLIGLFSNRGIDIEAIVLSKAVDEKAVRVPMVIVFQKTPQA